MTNTPHAPHRVCSIYAASTVNPISPINLHIYKRDHLYHYQYSFKSSILIAQSPLSLYLSLSVCQRALVVKMGLNLGEPATTRYLCFAIVYILAAGSVGAEDPYRFFTWNVSYGDIYPLGVRQQVVFFFSEMVFFSFFDLQCNMHAFFSQ